MRTQGYSTAELSGFYAVLDRAVREAAERDLGITIPVMVRRLFDAAANGERDPAKLMQAIFASEVSPGRAAA